MRVQTKAWFASLVAGIGAFVGLMARGTLTLDTGWGRSVVALRPITMRIPAPRALVFDYLAAPYLGRAPSASGGHGPTVWERGTDVVIAAHTTQLPGYRAVTVEAVGFERPTRIWFRHLRGPVPHARETFTLFDEPDGTRLEYEGEVGLDFGPLGRLAARHWVVPTWERVVRAALEDARDGAGTLHARRAAREQARVSPEPQ